MMKTVKIPFKGRELNVLTAGNGDRFLLFVHGNSQSAACWESQLLDVSLAMHYQLIAVDLPGHGRSDWFSEEEEGYTFQNLAEAITTVIGHFQPAYYLLCGVSLGTNLIGEVAGALQGCCGIVLAGACPVNDVQNPAVILQQIDALPVTILAEAGEAELATFCRYVAVDPAVQNDYGSSYRRTDPLFRTSVGKQLMAASWQDEIGNLARQGVPVLVVYGAEEAIVDTGYLNGAPFLWENKVYPVPEAGHLVNQDRPEAFNRLLADFAKAAFKSIPA